MFFLNSAKKEKITKIIKKTLSLPYISFEMMGEFTEITFCRSKECLKESQNEISEMETKIILFSFEKRNFLDKGLVIGKDAKTASQIIGMILAMEADETFEKFETPNAFFLNDGKESKLLKVLEEKRKILSKEYFDNYLNDNKQEEIL
jgi:hypothetical protein